MMVGTTIGIPSFQLRELKPREVKELSVTKFEFLKLGSEARLLIVRLLYILNELVHGRHSEESWL